MISIHEIVNEIVKSDDIANTALAKGYMNLSAYASSIQPTVAKLCKKEVQLKSIVIALSRIGRQERQVKPSEIKLLNLSIHPNLEEISYERSAQVLSKLNKADEILLGIKSDEFGTITMGMHEATIISTEKIIHEIKKEMKPIDPFFYKQELSGITVKFSLDYIDIPNVINHLTGVLAVKQINLVEVISTTTELTYILSFSDLEKAIGQLSRLM